MSPEEAQAAIGEQHEIAIALRDGFACAALTGLLAGRQTADPEHVAELAYAYADAMMTARASGPK